MKSQIPNIVCAAGIALITIGLWQVYPPLAALGGGSLLCVAGIILHRDQKGN